METSLFWNSGEDYYVGVSYYFPSSWPTPQTTYQWVNIGDVYGPPYGGPSASGLGVFKVAADEQVIAYQRTRSYNWDRPLQIPLERKKWYDIVMHIKLSPEPTEGYWEVWLNRGDGWERMTLNGEERLYTKTQNPGHSGAPNYHKIALYRSLGMWDVATLYVGHHRIGTSFEAVAPDSYGGDRSR